MSESGSDNESRSNKRKGNKGRYKTLSGILRSMTSLSLLRDRATKGEPMRSRSFEKISTYSDQEEDAKKTHIHSDHKTLTSIKQKEFIRRHSEFSIATSSRPRQPSMTVKELDENKKRVSYSKAKKKLNELLETEIRYVENELRLIVEDYYGHIEELRQSKNEKGLLEDFSKGTDLVIFANIKEIYDFHTRTFLPELKAAVDDPITLKSLFDARKDTFKYKYGRYCVSKPKSMETLIKHQEFFDKISVDKGLKRKLNDLMTTPVRRIQMYSLLMKDIEKLLEKAEQFEKAKHIRQAVDITTGIANYVNDMMLVGKIDGFVGDVNKHGLLLKRGVIECANKPNNVQQKNLKFKNCHVFLFQESIVICSEEEKKHEGGGGCQVQPSLKYWTQYPMNKLLITKISDANHTFELNIDSLSPRSTRTEEDEDGFDVVDEVGSPSEDKKEGIDNCIVFKCEDEESRNSWYREFNIHKSYLCSFADALSNPVM